MPSRQAKHLGKKVAAGEKRVSVWFRPEDLPALERLKQEYGSIQKGVRRAVLQTAKRLDE